MDNRYKMRNWSTSRIRGSPPYVGCGTIVTGTNPKIHKLGKASRTNLEYTSACQIFAASVISCPGLLNRMDPPNKASILMRATD